jgi:phage shock protein C
MYCTNCGIELHQDDRFCSQCAAPTALAPVSRFADRRLTLVRAGKKIGGVCTGFARYLEVDVTLVRIVWLMVGLLTGVGFLAYPVAWLLMPHEGAVPSGAPGSPGAELAHQNG